MYAVFPQWFSQSSHVLLVTPTYAEYPHILREIGCTVHEVSETMDVREVIRGSRYDGIVIVNPNSPSGRYVEDLQSVLEQVDITTRVWVDETYIDYVRADDGTSMSIERFASTTINVTVCKSMSKYYALSGARVAYLVAHPMVLSGIVSPPWWVPAYTQRLAVAALESEEYYRAESRHVRKNLQYMIDALQAMGFTVVGTPRASFATFTVMGVDATQVVDALKAKGIYVRLAVGYPNAIRIAPVSCLQDVYNA
jgi:histidinol-phosphate/aromatic aminotransferase/cobyric acid decarboxylase-like protein